MKYPCCRAIVLWTAALFVLPLWYSPSARAQSGPSRELKVGTFVRAYLVQAFYRSAAWQKHVQELVEKRNKAATASDIDTVDQIDNQLAGMQSLAQRQADGQAPLTNIYAVLKDDWAGIAKEAGVDVIVEPPLYLEPGSALHDITAVVVRHLAAKN